MGATYLASKPRIAFASIVGTDYSCWPNKLRHDPVRDKFFVMHNANDGHLSVNFSIIRAYTLAASVDTWSGPVTVNANAAGKYNECNGAVVLPNGDYIAYIVTRDGDNLGATGPCLVKRSTDGGASYSLIGNLLGDGVAVAPQLVAHAEYIDGFIFLLYTSASGATYVVKINAATPNVYPASASTLIDRTAIGSPTYCGEGRFIKTGANSYVCIARRDINGDYTVNMRPVFIATTDGGDSWTAWAYCTPAATEMTNGNMDAMSNGDGTFDLYFSSRRANSRDGFGQIWWSRVTAAQLQAGDVGRPTRLFLGDPSRDFGYPGVAQNADGSRRVLVWYDGNDTKTDIWFSILTKVTDVRNPGYVPSRRRAVTSSTRT